ncbi:MAG: hypothetical protein PQJ59_07655 [Spirochaetales bacterium]|nr:hypothetical protein [Spirochaetales bacterium]
MIEVETERLRLRNWTLADSEDVFDYAKSDLVGPNAGWLPHKSEDESKVVVHYYNISKDEYFETHEQERVL